MWHESHALCRKMCLYVYVTGDTDRMTRETEWRGACEGGQNGRLSYGPTHLIQDSSQQLSKESSHSLYTLYVMSPRELPTIATSPTESVQSRNNKCAHSMVYCCVNASNGLLNCYVSKIAL